MLFVDSFPYPIDDIDPILDLDSPPVGYDDSMNRPFRTSVKLRRFSALLIDVLCESNLKESANPRLKKSIKSPSAKTIILCTNHHG